MKKIRCMDRKTFVAFAALLFLSLADHAFCAVGGTLIHAVRAGTHGAYDRLVFDVEGARPSAVGPPSEESISIEFKQATSKVDLKKLASLLPPSVSKLEFEKTEQGLTAKITFKQPNATVKTSYNDWRPHCYRLVLDFYPPNPNAKHQSEGEAYARGARAEKSPQKRSPPAQLGPVQPVILDKLPNEVRSGDSKIDGLYKAADDAFSAAENDLPAKAAEIIELYNSAIKAGPRAPQLPMALFRSALCYLALKDPKNAEERFKRVIAEYPTHPTIPQCWLNLGRLLEAKKAWIEAVQALRTALSYPLRKEDETDGSYELGKALAAAGAYKEAIESMKRCLDEDPTYYRKKPDMLKALGESFFATQQYDKSCESFFRYLNLQKDIPDRDVILAKLAESLLYLGEHDLANRVYSYIERYHPDSEGDIIGRIRKAEILEQQDGRKQDSALEIYEELSQKSLSPPLTKLVLYRLADWKWKHGDYDKSLALIAQALQMKADSTQNDELTNLKGKVIVDWIKKAYADKDYSKVIQLYQDNKSQFQFWGSPEFDIMAADSYGELKLYPNAYELYQQVLARSGKKNDEWLYKTALYGYEVRDMDKAIQYALQIQSGNSENRKDELLGKIYYKQKKYKEAVQYFGKLFQNDKVFDQCNPDDLISYIESLMQIGKYSDAVATLQKASKHLEAADAEKQIQASLLESKCYQNLKQSDKAIETLEKILPVVKSEDLRDQITYSLSDLYLAEGNQDKAKEKLTQLLQSSQPLWKTAAQQQLDYIQLEDSKPKSTE